MKISVTVKVDLEDLATVLSFLTDHKGTPVRSKSDIIQSSISYLSEHIKRHNRAHHIVGEDKALQYLQNQGFLSNKVIQRGGD